jgi:hypothetical protein
METQFRGRLHMALASIFPISDKSGVNQKGLYNLNNSNWNYKNINEGKGMANYKFYQQFWILHRYLTNPFLVTIHK